MSKSIQSIEQAGVKLRYQVNAFKNNTEGIRHILVSRETGIPMLASSLYETHLRMKSDSHNSRFIELYYFAHLYSWSESVDLDLDRILLSGSCLSIAQVRSFASWIKSTRTGSNGVIPIQKRKGINSIFGACSVISTWFIQQYAFANIENNRSALDKERLIQAQRRYWKEVQIKSSKDSIAPDLTEDEVSTIEQFLKPTNRANYVGDAIANRDYLIWRMAIEFGMRLGEILAMRTIDCPTRAAPYFRVVRIEMRGDNYFDPRKNPPRPKTRSRDLGVMLRNSVFPKLVSEYVSGYRYKEMKHFGKKTRQFLLQHNFLIISKHGAPLSIRAADAIAKNIKNNTGIDFNWHLARHAFFNRAYFAVTNIDNREEQKVKLADLVYWGGWSDESSLEIYTKRARADRARLALCTWQKGGTEWISLN